MTTLEIETPRWFLPHLKPHTFHGIYGGRGSGKSHAVGEYLIEQSLDRKLDIACLREYQNSLDFSVKKLLESKIEKFGANHLFKIQYDKIKSVHGGVIIFKGMSSQNADSIKSLEGFDIFWLEEAQICSQRSLDLLIPTMRKDNAKMFFTWNPDKPSDPVDKYLRPENGILPPNTCVSRVNYLDNPWFPSVLRQQMAYMRDHYKDKYSHIWLGEYQTKSEARVFQNWRVEEFETPPGTLFRFGADFGYSVDPSVLVRAYTLGRTLYVDYEAYRIGCEIVNLPDLFMQIPEAEKWSITADSSRPETISHLRNNGFPKICASVKGVNSVEEGVAWLQSFDIVVHPRCRHVIDELASYNYKVDKKTEEILPILEDDNNHVIDALRYAFEALRRAEKQKKPVSVKTPLRVNHWR